MGVSGLINAYKISSIDAIENTTIQQQWIQHYYQVMFDYPQTPEIMRLLSAVNANIKNQVFEANCQINFSIKMEFDEQLKQKMTQLYTSELKFIETK